jgi:hypothetical protein
VCECIDAPSVMAGFGCCRCRTYNGLQRVECRACGAVRCVPLLPDRDTGEHFETYEEAYANDPEKLEAVKAALGGS